MDEKTADLRDIFVETTGSDTVTERQGESRGTLTDRDAAAVDERVRELVAALRDRYGFSTNLDDATYARIARASFEESDDENIEVTEHSRGHEHGYHAGMFIAFNEMMEQMYGYGVNVMGRANRYTKVNREHDMEFRLSDEPNYYHAVERGAEVKVMLNPLWEDIEIESLGPAPYVPRGADDE